MATKTISLACSVDGNPLRVIFHNRRISFCLGDDDDESKQVCLSRADAGRLMLEMQRFFHNESETEDHLARVLGMAYHQADGISGELPKRTFNDVARCEHALRRALFGPHQ